MIVGALGGRLDHTVANLQALCWLCTQGARGVILSADNRAWAVRDGALELPRMEGWYLSVFAAGECEGVTLRGVEYPLTGGAALPVDADRGEQRVFRRYGAHRGRARHPDRDRVAPGGPGHGEK